MTREELFKKAVELFGEDSTQAVHLQNPGCLTTEKEMMSVRFAVEEAILLKKKEFLKCKVGMAEWAAALAQAFDSGKLKEPS